MPLEWQKSRACQARVIVNTRFDVRRGTRAHLEKLEDVESNVKVGKLGVECLEVGVLCKCLGHVS